MPLALSDFVLTLPTLLGGIPEGPLWRHLDPVLRTKILMTLLGLILLGLLLVGLVLYGGRYVRRLVRQRSGPTNFRQDDWYRRPLTPPSEPSGDEVP